jgi:uncharacterized membrane protein
MGMYIRNPTPADCYRIFKDSSIIIIPIFLVGAILIGLLAYEIRYEETITDEQKKKIFYGELFLSFIVSIFILLHALVFMFFLTATKAGTNFLYNYGYIIPVGFTTPFILLIIRAFIKDKTYTQYLSGLTILSTLYSVYYNFHLLTFGACRNK